VGVSHKQIFNGQGFEIQEAEVESYDVMFFIFWIGLGLFVMLFSHKYGLGGFHNPGPGLMPFLLGLLLLLISFYLLIRSLFKKLKGDTVVEVRRDEEGQISIRKVSLVLASLFTYALLLERLGYMITTLLIMIFLFWIIGVKRWRSILFAAGLTVLVSYFLFTYLGLRFPLGIFRSLG
jgi:putative tricarboxylic transport membrane protein